MFCCSPCICDLLDFLDQLDYPFVTGPCACCPFCRSKLPSPNSFLTPTHSLDEIKMSPVSSHVAYKMAPFSCIPHTKHSTYLPHVLSGVRTWIWPCMTLPATLPYSAFSSTLMKSCGDQDVCFMPTRTQRHIFLLVNT